MVAFRNLSRHRGNTLIFLFGLVAALAGCLIFIPCVRYQLSFDGWQPDAGRSYQVQMTLRQPIALADNVARSKGRPHASSRLIALAARSGHVVRGVALAGTVDGVRFE